LPPRLGFDGPKGPTTTPIHTLVSPIFFAALVPEASSGMVSGDGSSSRMAAFHPLFPAHSGDKIFANEAPPARTWSAPKAVAATRTSSFFVARSELGAGP
jgi:hypothetical protein